MNSIDIFIKDYQASSQKFSQIHFISMNYLGSIPGHAIPKTLKMVLDTSLLNTQQYKVRSERKVEQSRKRSRSLPYTSV